MAEPGIWDVVIAGPGFARRVLPGIHVEDGKITDLGEVAVAHGHRITGTVRDQAGLPVPHATVSLVSHPVAAGDDALAALAKGNIAATTDREGRYEIDGATTPVLAGRHPEITAATTDNRRSLPHAVPDADAAIDLTVVRTGGVDVAFDPAVEAVVVLLPAGTRDVSLHGRRVPRGCVFDDVPAGDYAAQLLVPIRPIWLRSQHVSVSAGSVTSITIATPAMAPVAVTIHARGGPCDLIRLESPETATTAASEACTGRDIRFPGVVPGNYLACAARGSEQRQTCEMIEVDRTPASQQFDLPRQ